MSSCKCTAVLQLAVLILTSMGITVHHDKPVQLCLEPAQSLIQTCLLRHDHHQQITPSTCLNAVELYAMTGGSLVGLRDAQHLELQPGVDCCKTVHAANSLRHQDNVLHADFQVKPEAY